MKSSGGCPPAPLYKWTLEMPEIWEEKVGKIRKLDKTGSIFRNISVSNYWHFNDLRKSKVVPLKVKDIFTFSGESTIKMGEVTDALYYLERIIDEINNELERDTQYSNKGSHAKKEGLKLLLGSMTNAKELVQQTYFLIEDLPQTPVKTIDSLNECGSKALPTNFPTMSSATKYYQIL